MRIRYKNKQKMIILVIIIFCILLIPPIQSIAIEDTKKINFNDKNLYNAVIEQLDGKISIESNNTEMSITLTLNDISKIETLELNNKEITDISGIENFNNLIELNLSNNKITNVSELSNLTSLKILKVDGCNLSIISFINSLTNLEELYLANNELSDSGRTEENSIVSQIADLTSLKTLDISHNYLQYTKQLSNFMQLTNLNLYRNNISNLNGLENLVELEYLNLGANNTSASTTKMGNISNIGNLSNLKYLDFSENYNADIINYIENLTKLEELNLERNRLTEIPDTIVNLTYLKTINLFGNNLVDVSKLTQLSNLQNIVIGKNKIEDISSFYDNELIFENLISLDISDNTLNEQLNNDVLTCLCQQSANEQIQLDYEYIYKYTISNINDLVCVDENGIKYVTYDDFGARCNGIYDDFIAIRNAHLFANEYNYEVRATSGKTYHIFKYYADAVDITTNTNWCDANFIIHDEDIEEKSGRYKKIFIIRNMNTSLAVTIKNPEWTINTKTKKIEEVKAYIENLNKLGYTRYFCIAENSNLKQYIRYSGATSTSSGNNQQDYFIIDSETNLLNDIQWDFDTVTSFTIYPIPNDEITVENGNFTTNIVKRKSDHELKSAYYARNIAVNNASNITLSRIKHTVNEDELCSEYAGFLFTNLCTDLKILNCELYTHKYITCSKYDMKLQKCVNVICDGITSNDIQDDNRWGVLATHYCKDVIFRNCTLNRIDAHEGIYNLDVVNCTIGIKGLTMTGQGILNVYNTAITANSFITLRQDYGSTWNGTVNIVDSTYRYTGIYQPKIITATLSYDTDSEGNKIMHDFGYDCKFPNVNIQNLTIDMEENSTYSSVCVITLNNLTASGQYIDAAIAHLPNYSPDSVYVNGYNFINDTKNSKLIVAVSNFKNYLESYNYVIEDVTFNLNNSPGEDLTTRFSEDKDIFVNDDVYFNINNINSSTNTVSIYKDEILIVDNQQIDEDYYNLFSESGRYRIITTSEDAYLKFSGKKEYEFTIDQQAPQIIGVEIDKIYEKVTPIVTDDNLDTVALTKDGIVQENYKNGDEITEEGNYVITAIDKAGNKITVSFTVQMTTVEEKLEIAIRSYEVSEENGIKYLENIKPETTIQGILNDMETNGIVEVYLGTNKMVDTNIKAVTGMAIKISLGTQEETYTLVVTGDLNGDGQMGNVDLLKLVRYNAGLDTNLSRAYLRATDIYKDGEYADNKDILKMARVLTGLEEL